MSKNLIYHEEKIQHSLNIYKLYILRLPKTTLQYQQLDQIISQNNIKHILYFGTEILEHKIDGLEVVWHQSQIDDVVNNIHSKLYSEQQNVGLMCSSNCEKSLKHYFNYMVLMERVKFEDLQFNLFANFFSKEQLQQCYDDVKKQSQNPDIFSYDLLNTNPIEHQNIFEPTLKSEQSQSVSSQKQTTIINTGSVASNCESEIRILGMKDQVISQYYPVEDQSNISQKVQIKSTEQHQLLFAEKQQPVYKIPQKIHFVHFIPQEGFKCLE